MIEGRTRDDGTPCSFGGCRFNRPADRKDSFRNWSPKLGFVYSVNDNNQVYGSLARGFRAPQATELYRLQTAQNVADIDSVELDSLELGLRGSTTRLDYNVSFFDMQKENFIFRDISRRNVDGGKTSHRGAFEDVSATAGVDHPGWGTAAAFHDLDADGDLDLLLVNYLTWGIAAELECYDQGAPSYCSPNDYNMPAADRLFRNNGDVIYALKTPYSDGTTHVVLSPLEFIGRLAALVPKPRVNLTRFHGVFSPISKLRGKVVPAKPVKDEQSGSPHRSPHNRSPPENMFEHTTTLF